ncbi:hypothetical protein [Nocardioides sp. YIM 152315]|uniref:hypothetical protein n=1 Tax=Nocardioides sp. YIM 152315 TaxID=3031760 RepID=UPI0023DBA5D8|nr:hypothetical protein [Nocardioides sp. YIM 152315]MDF1605137.1 hypothetical protein [Nocardioides sp. YIM 152315]
MSIDTEIEGKPATIESAADWLRDKLAVKIGAAADRMNDARRDADASWESKAGDEFSSCMRKGRDKVDDLEKAAKKMGGDLDDFAEKLRTCQQDMQTIRSDASAAGLTVAGFLIQDPGPGPARPPDNFTGTEAEVAAHNDKVAAYDAHQLLITAYSHAASEAARIDRKYATACRELQDEYTVGQHASWLLTSTEILGDAAAGAVGVQIGLQQSKLHTKAQDLVDDARRAVDDLQAHPERYLKRKWLFFKTLDDAKLEADRLAIQGKLDEAEDLLRRSSALDDAKLPKFLGRAGKVLGPLGLGLGIYNDYQEGESGTQIVVSQGASAAAGIAAGAGASALTGMAIGAAAGSVVPGVGTAVGAVVGTVVGAGVAIFADGAIDSLFENGPDVGKAFDEGLDALADTGDTIADGVSSVADTVGGWFS